LSAKKRFLIPLACGTALGLFTLSGLSCVICQQGPTTGHARPTTESESRPYIMSECLSVKESLQGILGDPPYEVNRQGFDAIRDWVAYNIEYKPDEERAGKTDDWQTPGETLASPRVGDCEDFSILLCSLLRAYGIGAERVYVVIGVDSKGGEHAFLMEDWYLDGKWRRIEPQAPAQLRPGPLSFLLISSGLDQYEIIAAFNDLHYHDESFPWDEDVENFWTLPSMATATGEIARRLSQVLGYLRGLVFS
jgi:predicted transglutaminase-like cysteine proteinase